MSSGIRLHGPRRAHAGHSNRSLVARRCRSSETQPHRCRDVYRCRPSSEINPPSLSTTGWLSRHGLTRSPRSCRTSRLLPPLRPRPASCRQYSSTAAMRRQQRATCRFEIGVEAMHVATRARLSGRLEQGRTEFNAPTIRARASVDAARVFERERLLCVCVEHAGTSKHAGRESQAWLGFISQRARRARARTTRCCTLEREAIAALLPRRAGKTSLDVPFCH